MNEISKHTKEKVIIKKVKPLITCPPEKGIKTAYRFRLKNPFKNFSYYSILWQIFSIPLNKNGKDC